MEGVWGCVSCQYEHSRAGGEFVMGETYTRDLELSLPDYPLTFLGSNQKKSQWWSHDCRVLQLIISNHVMHPDCNHVTTTMLRQSEL